LTLERIPDRTSKVTPLIETQGAVTGWITVARSAVNRQSMGGTQPKLAHTPTIAMDSASNGR
jgi:hypothetical protein